MNADHLQAQHLADIPGLRTPGDLLYVGANAMRCAGLPGLVAVGHRVTLLEIWPVNAMIYRGVYDLAAVVCGDVRKVDTLGLGPFDVTVWLHGPEHLARDEVAGTIAKLETITRRLVVLASPWGRYEQSEVFGNPYERHLCELYPADYEAMGYQVVTFGQADDKHTGRLTAWKVMEVAA